MTDNRFTRHLLALGLVFASLTVLPGALHAQQRHGDVNGDGVVSALDAQAILSAVVGLTLPPTFVLGNGDSNCDSTTAALDAQIVLSYVIGLSTSQFCVGQPFGPASTRLTVVPGNDTSLLVNRGIRLRAALTDAGGFLIQRAVRWETSNSDLVTIDSARGDTAWVSNHFTTTGAADASATITAFSDGVSATRNIRVFRSYAGIVITPQRPDTLRQLNGTTNFTVRSRDSLGVLSSFPNALWTTGTPTIASVPGTASNNQNVTALTMGSTFLYAVSQTNPAVRDSVRLIVQLPPLNTCTGTGGTLHGFANYTTPQVWSPATNPHYLTSTQNFNAGSSLTIEPGTLICTQGGGYIAIHEGARLTALGTVTQPIVFRPTTPTDFWSGIQLGDFTSLQATAPPDTSRLRNVIVERASNGNGAIDGRERHVVLMDSVTVRQSNATAVTLMTAGSQMLRSRVDTILSASTFNYGVTLGRGSLEESTIRLAGNASGIQIVESARVRQVQIFNPARGIVQACCTTSGRINDVTITTPQEVALQLEWGLIDPASGNISVTGGAAGVFRGQIGNFGHLFRDSLAQETLKNNGKDTVFISGGALTGVTQVVRPDLPWVVTNQTTIDTLAQLAPRPGASISFENGGFIFQRGATMNAVGEPAKFIRFRPFNGQTFYGLRFDSPGAGPNPALAPTVVSTLQYVRVDSTSGQGVNEGLCCFSSAIAGALRHRLMLDSVVVHKAQNTAVLLSARGSEMRRSWIDTTGNVGTNYTTGQPAVALNDSTRLIDSRVDRSGSNGIYAQGTGARLTNVRVVASRGVGIHAEGGIIDSTSTNVRVDSANAYPFYGRVENFGIIANTAALQTANLLGNTDNLAIFTGGNLVRDTVDVIPALRWQIITTVTIDTIGRLVPQPGAQLTFQNGAMLWFQRGGHMDAIGTPGNFIRFRPATGADAFGGLRFDSPGAGPNPALAPTSLSRMSYVRVDSASGQGINEGLCCFSAAIASATRHRMELDSVVVHKAMNTAVALNARRSVIQRSWIDTTGNIGTNWTTGQPALVLNDSARAENVLVARSGSNGIYAQGTGVRLTNVRVVDSRGVGIHAEGGIIDSTSSGVRADSTNAYPFHGRIENMGILAASGAAQTARFLGNSTNVVYITGGNLTRDTVEAIAALPWRVIQTTTIDTLARFMPQPGADINFQNGVMLWFQRGGTLEAIGTPGAFIRFRPLSGTDAFGGLRFDSPGAGVNPALAPTSLSRMSYVRVDSASGQGVNEGLCCFSATIASATRHRMEMDSVIVHKAHNTAVALNARRSFMRRSWIDTTGNVASGYTTGQPAVVLNDSASLENSLVVRSGSNGVYAQGTGARLSNVRIMDSRGVGLHAEGGNLGGDQGTVRIDGANAYPFHGTIQNVSVLARDPAAQAQWLGNTSNVIIVTSGVLTNDTLTTSAAFEWRFINSDAQISTAARFIPSAGTLMTFQSAGLWFRNGGTMLALGTTADTIRFRPVAGQTFHGLRFDDVAPQAFPSRLSFVRVDSASGQGVTPTPFCCSAAVNASSTHVMLVDNSRIQRSRSGALWLAAPLSSITNVLVDTTGTGAGFTSGQAAVAMNDNVGATNLTIRRSGQTGLYVDGPGITFNNVQILGSLNVGLHVGNNNTPANGGSQGLQLSSFTVDGTIGSGVYVDAFGVGVSGCNIRNSGSHGFQTSSGLAGVTITGCNIEDNAGYGVFNQNNVATPNTNLISASNNFWAILGVSTPPTPSTTPVANGASGNTSPDSPATTRFP